MDNTIKFIICKIFVISFVFYSSYAASEIHMWKDEHGRTHFGDKPPATAESQVIEVKINTYESPSIEKYDRSLSSGSKKVVMYSTTWCGVCVKAKNYFKENNIAFSEYDVEKSSKGKRDYKKLDGRGVPIILVGDNRLNGFSASRFEQIYNNRQLKLIREYPVI